MSDYYFRGYITNLGKYNEGELIGKWITFPITKKELDKALREIGVNENYEEWFLPTLTANILTMSAIYYASILLFHHLIKWFLPLTK